MDDPFLIPFIRSIEIVGITHVGARLERKASDQRYSGSMHSRNYLHLFTDIGLMALPNFWANPNDIIT
jgi:hypothetical protein